MITMEGNPFKRFLARNVLLTHEVAEKLNVSRQRISVLHKEDELLPIKSTANGSVYLWKDVLQLMETKGMLLRYENPTPPKYACETSDTHENVAYAKKHLDQLNSIERVSIYFENIDAAVENHFLPLEKYRYGDLISLSIPHMVISDSDRNEMWPEISRLLGLVRQTIRSYWRLYETGGIEGLPRQHPPGKPSKMSKEEHEQLAELLVHKQPVDVGFDSRYTWTLPLIAAWIKQEFGH